MSGDLLHLLLLPGSTTLHLYLSTSNLTLQPPQEEFSNLQSFDDMD